ncbi:hypothetical protein [Halovenus salina]|nr:hypothetical protein [Halovenus salina]
MGSGACAASPIRTDDLEDAIVDILESIAAGDTSKTLSVRDDHLAALILGLEDAEKLDDVGATLETELDQTSDSESFDRSEIMRLAIRAGLEEAAPEVVETARDAYGRHAANSF